MDNSDWMLLIAVLTYIGIGFVDIVNLINEIVAEFGKLILFAIIIYIIYHATKK